jgi:hypothetical protein
MMRTIFKQRKGLIQKCNLPKPNKKENLYPLTRASALAAGFASMLAHWKKAKASGIQ